MERYPRTFTRQYYPPLRRRKALSLHTIVIQSITDTLTLTQTITTFNVITKSISQTLTPTQSISFVHNDYAQHTDTLSLSQSITVAHTISKTITDTLALTQSITSSRSYPFHQTLFLTQSLTLEQRLTTPIDIIDTSCNIYAHPYTISHTLPLRQCIDYELLHYPRIFYQSITQTLPITDSIHQTTGQIIHFAVSDTLSFTESINDVLGTSIFRSITDTLTFTEIIAPGYGVIISKSITDTLTLTQSLTKSRVIALSISQSLTLSQSYTHHKLIKIRIKQSLPIHQTISKSSIFNLSLSQHLTFITDFYHRELNYNQGIDIPTLILVHTPYYNRSRRFIRLRADADQVILPFPEFDNTESNEGVISLKRSMTGRSFTYLKTTPVTKLKFSFRLTITKRRELFNFFDKYYSTPLTIDDWRDQLWMAYLTSNPIVANNSARDLSEVELEFEGLKIN